MKETNHDKYCRKSTILIKDNSESENKLAGHSHRKIDFKRIYQRRTELSSN